MSQRSVIGPLGRAWLGIGVVAVCAFATLLADETAAPLRDTDRARLHARLDGEIAELTAKIDKASGNVELYSRRGDAYFFRSRFAAAVGDFDKMVALQPDLEASHWRRGIACFYAGRYRDAARQFEIYHSFDDVDRENGIWRYLSQVKAVGRDEARKGLLKYQKDDREPFPDVYRLFAGAMTGSQILERIARAKITDDERARRLFYAELYIGLNEFVDGDLESAEAHLGKAVGNRWGENAGGGPGWMWQVGRIHYDLLRDARRKKSDKSP
jgi:lipoprotein NlpI